MFTVNGYMVPFPDFHKVESQLDIRATILCCTGEPKEVEETCRTNATDYWTVQHQGKKSLVGFINPKDALLTKLQFDTEHTDFIFEKPKWVRPVSLLLDCTPNSSMVCWLLPGRIATSW